MTRAAGKATNYFFTGAERDVKEARDHRRALARQSVQANRVLDDMIADKVEL